jgi:hypothetical protein
MNPAIVGIWQLVATLALHDELPLFDDIPPRLVAIDEWLYGNSHELIRQATPIAGLQLQLNADATFTETKTQDLDLEWYDVEGVSAPSVIPFDGVIRADDDHLYLHPDTESTLEDPVRSYRVRYDDGDTTICDRAELVQDRLVRTMSVVTDELYLDRSILIYQKVNQPITVPGLGMVTKDSDYGAYYSQPLPISVLGNRLCQIVLEGYDTDAYPADFHLAIANFLSIGPAVLHDASVHVFRYYQDCLGTADDIPMIAAAADVWQHVHFRNQLEIQVSRNNYVDEEVYISLSCSCDWEDEHGLQLVFKHGLWVSRVGPNDGHLTNMDENSVYP